MHIQQKKITTQSCDFEKTNKTDRPRHLPLDRIAVYSKQTFPSKTTRKAHQGIAGCQENLAVASAEGHYRRMEE